jgi:hypothetical protein
MPPPANHRQVDASFAALYFDGQDVNITVRHVVDRLLVKHIGQRGDLVANFSRLLKLQSLRMRHHPGL